MAEWTYSDTDPPSRWKVGVWVWRVDDKWRLRLYRPWNKSRMIEIQCKDFLQAVYLLGVGANWWKS